MPSALVPLADGSEELEAISITNPLRRAGVDVTVASIKAGGELVVECARGTKITCDKHLNDCLNDTFDIVVLPGGMPGATNFHECTSLVELLKKRNANKQWNAAICASPAVVFAQNGLLRDKATCYPAPKFLEMLGDKLVKEDGGDKNNVVVDGDVITSVGPGTALEFGLKLVCILCGEAKGKEIAESMKFQGPPIA